MIITDTLILGILGTAFLGAAVVKSLNKKQEPQQEAPTEPRQEAQQEAPTERKKRVGRPKGSTKTKKAV